jgi:hypothetical protein
MSFVGLFPAMVLLVGIGANGVVNLQRNMSRLSGARITIRAASFAVRAVRRFVWSLPTPLAGLEGAMLVSSSYATASWFEAAAQQMLARLQVSPS